MTAEQLRKQLVEIEMYARTRCLADDAGNKPDPNSALVHIANTLSQLAARLSGMAAVPTWQPIGTAPKDDQWILGWRAHDVKPLIVRFDPLFDEFEDESGTHIYHLTYWHSLPAAPEPPHV